MKPATPRQFQVYRVPLTWKADVWSLRLRRGPCAGASRARDWNDLPPAEHSSPDAEDGASKPKHLHVYETLG
jgi:hypothetical protein